MGRQLFVNGLTELIETVESLSSIVREGSNDPEVLKDGLSVAANGYLRSVELYRFSLDVDDPIINNSNVRFTLDLTRLLFDSYIVYLISGLSKDGRVRADKDDLFVLSWSIKNVKSRLIMIRDVLLRSGAVGEA